MGEGWAEYWQGVSLFSYPLSHRLPGAVRPRTAQQGRGAARARGGGGEAGRAPGKRGARRRQTCSGEAWWMKKMSELWLDDSKKAKRVKKKTNLKQVRKTKS